MATKSRSRSGSRSKSGKSKKVTAAQRQARSQMHAIVLFALGILIMALTFIKGASAWNWIHNALFALFGIGVIFVGVTLIYIAILQTTEKPWKARALLCSLTVVSFCGALQIFEEQTPNFDDHVLELVTESILQGINGHGGGLLGTLLGFPLLRFCGKVGGGILIVVLIAVLLMLLSGATLIGMARAAHKPIRAVGDAYADQMARQVERRRQVEDKRKSEPKKAAPAKAPSKQEPAAKGKVKMQLIDIPLDGEERKAQAEPQAQEEAPPQEPKPEPRLPEVKKTDIDISLDDDFRSSETGGFSLGMEVKEPPHVEQTDPTLDELVSKAATSEVHIIDDIPAAKAAEPVQAEEKLAFHLNLPPDIDLVEGFDGPPEDDPFFAKHREPPAQDHSGAQEPVIPSVMTEKPAPVRQEAAAAAPVPPDPPKKLVYHKPPFTLLRTGKGPGAANTDEMKANAQLLVDTLASFGVQTRIVDISRGPAVTRYELQPSAGVKISKITGLADDIALNLAAAGVRIEAPIPNKAAVGIEVPNKSVSMVTLREIVDSEPFLSAKSKLAVALGRDIAGNVTLADIAKMPHLLIAGSTGSGKSVCINSIIMSLLFRAQPEEVRFLMIDPKVVELGVYNGIPHLLVPVVTDPKKAAGALSWAVTEMLKRYKLFADNSVRDLNGFNNLADRTEGLERMPQVVIIIDELADLMMAAPNEIEDYICRLAQMARAAGMHLIIATQRPSVDVITGVIKANIPSRIAFAVSSQIDSRTILDMGGAEKLLGRGDMLFNPVGSAKPIRVQGCFVTDEEIEAVISFIKNDATADYDQQIVQEIDSHVVAGKGGKGSGSAASADNGDGGAEDEMLMAAIECVVEAGMASTSLLQRRLKLGYARAARIVDEMEARGIVGPFEGSKPRQVLLTPERLAELKLAQQN